VAVPRLTPALRYVLGDRQVDPRQGTAVTKDYQKKAASATMPVLPQVVSIAMVELAGEMQEGLLAMAVGTGLQVMAAMMSADLEAACGPRGKHDPKRMRAAYHGDSAIVAQAQLEALAKELERIHPGAAGSLREGLAETLTVLRLDISPTLARTLRSTNSIESMISIARTHSTNVKNWQNGNMTLRWCAAGMIEARGQFRRVNGHLHLPALRSRRTSAHKLPVPPAMMTT